MGDDGNWISSAHEVDREHDGAILISVRHTDDPIDMDPRMVVTADQAFALSVALLHTLSKLGLTWSPMEWRMVPITPEMRAEWLQRNEDYAYEELAQSQALAREAAEQGEPEAPQ